MPTHSGKVVSSRGYVMVRVPKGHHLAQAHGYAPEHRLVAEAMLGRQLQPGEVVHHKDHDRANNTPENLEILTLAQHKIRHGRRKRRGYIGEANPWIACRCGCGQWITQYSSNGRARQFVSGHNLHPTPGAKATSPPAISLHVLSSTQPHYRCAYCQTYRDCQHQLEARLWAKVRRTDGCWWWDGYRDPRQGYGLIRSNGRQYVVHRLVYTWACSDIPPDMVVMHHCDNRACVRPDHLQLGSRANNMRDMAAKGRWRNGAAWAGPAGLYRGENNGYAKLTEAQVRLIRQRFAAGGISMRALGQEFDVTHRTIGNIIHGHQWAHVV